MSEKHTESLYDWDLLIPGAIAERMYAIGQYRRGDAMCDVVTESDLVSSLNTI